MSILLKDIEELRSIVSDIYELDSSKKYLVMIEKRLEPAKMEALRNLTQTAGVSMMFVSGLNTGELKIFELEHQL